MPNDTPNNLRQELINQLSELSLSLCDTLERVDSADLESNLKSSAGKQQRSENTARAARPKKLVSPDDVQSATTSDLFKLAEDSSDLV